MDLIECVISWWYKAITTVTNQSSTSKAMLPHSHVLGIVLALCPNAAKLIQASESVFSLSPTRYADIQSIRKPSATTLSREPAVMTLLAEAEDVPV